MAVILWAGEESAASCRAAAAKRGFDDFEGAPIEISTTNRKHCGTLHLPSGKRVIVHRVDRHLLPEIEYVGDMPVTSMRRTLLDLVALGHRRAESVLDAARRRGLTNVGQLWLYVELEWMRGRRGVRRMRDLLIPRTEGRAPAEGELEIMMRGLIDQHGLPEPVHQLPVSLPSGEIRIDIAYPEARLAIELDGYIWHMDREAFERDRQRDNELTAVGWTVFRFTWATLRFESARVVNLVRNYLEHRAAPSVQKPGL